MQEQQQTPEFTTRYVNLASPKLGSTVEFATDEFFAPKERMLQDSDPVFIEDKYDDHGKWMDGWESRRRRDGGHDWCLIRLGVSSLIKGVDIDTSHFTGNYPPQASLEGCQSDEQPSDENDWTPLVPVSDLSSSTHHFFDVDMTASPVNWLRLQIFPDGGIARLRVYGQPDCDWQHLESLGSVELSALKNGGRIVGYNDAHYGDLWALLSEGRGKTMGDGWETRRRREPGNDWMVIALGHAGLVEKIEIDTAHFKGNYPDRFSVQGAQVKSDSDSSINKAAVDWDELLAPEKLQADAIHEYEGEAIKDIGPITHVRLNIYPDGGVSRFRVFGRPAQ